MKVVVSEVKKKGNKLKRIVPEMQFFIGVV